MTTRGANESRTPAGATPVEIGSKPGRRGAASSRAKARKGSRAILAVESPSRSTLEGQPSRAPGGEGQDSGRLIAQERSRIAADVHDLVMQDLALAVAMSRTLARDPNPSEEASVIVEAGERALAAARQLVDGLVEVDPQPVQEAVEAGVRAAARGVPVSFGADGVNRGAGPGRQTRDTLVHIGREAVTNAVKHGSPASIAVRLEFGDVWQLTVRDDGTGFDPAGAVRGFGLESMRRQAQALGGSLSVVSAAGAGTAVEVILP